MGRNMRPPGLQWLLAGTLFLLISPLSVTTQGLDPSDSSSTGDAIEGHRVQRDVNGVTTVLLVPARPGKSVPPVGLLTKEARTFVQDGASTEYATQVLGTTLDNGRLYARILSTSSRVFYEKEASPDPVSPYVVYPSRAPEDEWQLRVDLENAPVKIAKDLLSRNNEEDEEDARESSERSDDSKASGSETSLPSERENDVFSKRNENQRFKPAKVRAADNLPTYTVKQDYRLAGGFAESAEEEAPRNFRPRVPKIFKQPSRASPPKKIETRPLATVTYHGFADFTTIVGDTVIVFSPSTSPAPVGRAATTIKGDATLRPDDGIGIVIQPTSVISGREKTAQPGRQRDPLLDAINGGRLDPTENYGTLQPSTSVEIEEDSSSRVNTPILVADTESLKPTGLLKVLDSTTATDGTTTHYKSLIYGTYIGTNYAQIIHTSSNVYFFPDEASATYDNQDTTLDYSTTDTEPERPEYGTTLEMPKSTTSKPISRTNKNNKPESNEVTAPPYRATTENIRTTLKDILANAKKRLSTTTEASNNVDSEITNDIVAADPQGRSIKVSSPQNNFAPNAKDKKNEVSFATRTLPSTVYKTFTYYTTFFVPDGDRTTTSVKSREVVSTEVTHLTELILPSATIKPSQSTITNDATKIEHSTTPKVTTEAPEEEQSTKKEEEIELIFKTLYTTYTYLTTFFQESTSSISSREVVETNVVTQTVGPNGVSEDVVGLFDRDESVVIAATSVTMTLLPTVSLQPGTESTDSETITTEDSATTLGETTEDTLTTVQDQETTMDDSFTTEDEDPATNLEPSPTPSMATEVPKGQVKTYFTTYTYFTTIFVDDETEIETRTEVFTNVVTEGIEPTAVVTPAASSAESPKTEEKPAPPPEILAYLEAIQRQKSQEEALLLAKKVKEMSLETPQETTINDITTESLSDDDLTTLDEKFATEKAVTDSSLNAQVTPNPPVDGEVIGSMITDVISSSSSGGGTVLGVMDKRNAVPEDQELSESNHHDVESAPTLLLQTSYTTFTYFTTMYKGDATNVVSRLDTVTNVVTETIRPTAVVPAETSTLPVTYFTTFTYWTTFYKGGDTVTTSREETVSNVVTPGISPTPTLELGVVMTYRPDSTLSPVYRDGKESKAVSDNEVKLSDILSERITTEKIGIVTPQQIVTLPDSNKVDVSTINPEPTTFYTTFTYFTTSYIGNETILNSRLETITSVSYPEATVGSATPRAIGGGDLTVQTLATDEKTKPTSEDVKPTTKSDEGPKTGLISTIRSSKIADGTTTHFATDVFGTYIDGLYAQVVESTSRLEVPTPSLVSSVTPVLPTGVISLNEGSIVDADEVTTIYFTTKQIGTSIDGLYAKVIESTSSTKIDAEKKATIAPVQGHRTGLVRLIQGHIETNDVTTFYQSRVIGTSIDGRYAQIIESTSSFVGSTPTAGISPTSTLPPGAATGIPEISPSPAVIQSSLSEEATTESPDNNEDDSSEQQEEDGEDSEEDGEDEDGQKSRKKSRLTFSSRKRTFTPVIRPFLSRSRPTFNPKRKGAQVATTITRTDITPTITATLAGKSNRFASTRGRVSSPIGPYSSTLSPSGSRRFSGRGRASSSLSPSSSTSFPAGSSRGRGSPSRIAPSSTFSVNRRGPSSIRGSSARPSGPRGSSSVYLGSSSRFRPGIRPSSTLAKVQPTARHEDQEDEANEFSTTTLTTEETPHTEYEDGGETVTAPLQTTTESSRRSTNPLLRFRRPLNLSGGQRAVVTPRVPVSTQPPRRSTSLARNTATTQPPNRGSVRAGNRATPPLISRTRQGGQLFPPRGFANKKPEPIVETPENEEGEFEGENEENFEDDPVEEIADNDYEGSEDAATTTRYNRRQGKSASTVSIRPFEAYRRGRRVRRQASQLRSLTNRFRKPSTARAEDRSDTDVSASTEDLSKLSTPVKQSARYSARGRSLTSPRPSPNSPKTSAERVSSESSEAKSPRVRTNPRVKPSPTSGSSRQFTLREKDSTSRSVYKRPSSPSSRSRPTGSKQDNLRSRTRVRGSSRSAELVANNRRSSSRSNSRSSSRNGGRRVPQRGRGSHEDIRESPFVYKDNDGTITVTHYVPTEATVPVVNNGITEQKSIITARPSTEVLGPEQYSTVVGTNGRPLVVIVTEATGSNGQGQIEVTRFLLHETPTTRVSYTLTSLGGRRASQSVIVPSTIYSVENVVSTIQPSLPGNGPLANILLSQLLLGQLNQQNPLLGGVQPQASPTTQYNTRTTSYVTTITKHQSTVIPLTFRGKEILTTLVDTSTNVVTATEFITDTVVVTPTAALPAAGLNSLLMLLQQPQQQQQQSQHALLDPLFAAAPPPLLTQSNALPGEVERRNQPADFDYKPSYEESEEEIQQKPARSRVRISNKYNDKKAEKAPESSVVTLYVSGRRPGEFSTVLSTVKIGDEATTAPSRRRRDEERVRASAAPSLDAALDFASHISGSEEHVVAHAPTQSLESVVGDVGRHISTSVRA